MSVASIRALIYAVVNNVADAGQVYDHFRWSNDVTSLYDLYKTTIDSTAQLRGWALKWLGMDQVQESLGRDDKDIQRLYHWRLDGWLGLDDSADTEVTFDNLVEAVCESLDGSTSINNADVCLYREPTDCAVDEVIFAGNVCHHAAILFDIAEDAGEGRYIIHDTFTGTEALSAHSPDVNRRGNAWAGSGTLGGGGYVTPSGVNVIDVEESDLTIQMTHATAGVRGRTLGLICRYVDADNYWFIRTVLDASGDGTFDIIKRESASESTAATTALSSVGTAASGFIWRAVLNGSTITANFYDSDGTTSLARLVYSSATFQQTETEHLVDTRAEYTTEGE